MTFRQENATSGDMVRGKTTDQLFCSLLPAPVGIIVESDIDDARAATQLAELVGVEMRAQRAGYVGEARMPQRSIVEQAFNQDDLRAVVNLLPAIQTALAAGQEAMGEGGADTAAVEVDDVLTLVQGEDDALKESICTASVDEAAPEQHIERVTLRD